MRMEIAEHLRPAFACPAMRVDQRLRVDFEMRRGVGVDIGRYDKARDVIGSAKKYPACFVRVGIVRCYLQH